MLFQSGLTDAGALQDQWGAECATADNDELAGLVDLGLVLGYAEGFGRHGLDTDSAVTLDDHPAHGQQRQTSLARSACLTSRPWC